MAKEYIERSVLREIYLSSKRENTHHTQEARHVHQQEHIHILNLLDKAPAADVVEIVHAQWDDNGRCTNCGKQANVQSIGFGCCPDALRVNYERTRFCSECGAKMDGKEQT